ncbi:MAG: hypothetical protein GXO91_07170, partial [FCB group bacterium]|nr:hypothetical protein [FCB group bacterium]
MSNLKKLSIILIGLSISFIFAQGVTLTFGNVDLDNGTMEVYMQNDEPVAGFQFSVSNILLTGASGGSAGAAGFMMSTNSSGLVLGFSLTGSTIPAGEGVLTILAIDGLIDPAAQACITSATISGEGGNAIDTDFGACWPETTPQLNAPTDLAAVGGDGMISLTWNHTVNRDVVDLSISNYDAGTGQLEIYMSNTEAVGGFQFDLDASFGDFEVTGASGGSAGAAGFMMSTNASGLVLGFSLTGATIPAGEGALCYVDVTFTGDTGSFNISSATVSDGSGSALSTSLGDPYFIGELPPTITFNVYRDGSLLADGIGDMAYFDTGLGYSESHCYTVTAFDGTDESDPSNEACATTDALLGCTDPNAINYNPDATEDDGSCIYLDAPTDLVAVGGDGEIDLSWNAPAREVVDLSVSDYNADTGQLEIYMTNTEAVGGFQFDLDASFGDFEVTGASGGSAGGA